MFKLQKGFKLIFRLFRSIISKNKNIPKHLVLLIFFIEKKIIIRKNTSVIINRKSL